MKNKTTKFLLKMALLFPVGFLFPLLTNGVDNFNLVSSVILGLVFSFGVVFWNLFDYENMTRWHMKTLEFKASCIKTEIERKFTDSVLTAERTPTAIIIKN